MNRADRTYSVKITTEIQLSIATAAEWFAGLSDDDQAQFFIEVARIGSGWGALNASGQWWRIGEHLKGCQCSTPEARELVTQMFDGLQNGRIRTED